MIDNKKIALIHTIKKKSLMSDEEYRKILKESAGVNSSKELTDESFKKVMKYFIKTSHFKTDKNGITLKQKMYIEVLIKNMKWDNEHFINYIKKYYHMDNLEQFDKKAGSNLINSLIKITESKKQHE